MSTAGVIDERSGRRAGHLCWIADEETSFLDGAVGFVAEGHRRNERVLLVADEAVWPSAEARLADLGLDPAAMCAQGSLVMKSPHGACLTRPLDIGRQVRIYETLVETALSDGYAGLRLAADATQLVTSEADRRRFVAYELAIDRFIASAPMTALCGYDRRSLGTGARELCAVHPAHHAAPAADPAFRLFYDGERLCLTGEVDVANHAVLAVALDAATATAERQVLIDIGSLGFIDVGGLDVVRRAADRLAADGRTLRLTRPSAIVRRTCEILGFPAIGTQPLELECA